MLNGWLFGVDVNRVRPELRERLMQYQRECFQVLNAHFNRPSHLPKREAELMVMSESLEVQTKVYDRMTARILDLLPLPKKR